MDRKIIFDGYYKTHEYENFIEVKRANISSIMFDRIYVLLAKILFYRQAKNTDAFLTLLLFDLPETYDQKNSQHQYSNKERIFEIFQPAIANNLLRIEFIAITEEEMQVESMKETAASISKN